MNRTKCVVKVVARVEEVTHKKKEKEKYLGFRVIIIIIIIIGNAFVGELKSQ